MNQGLKEGWWFQITLLFTASPRTVFCFYFLPFYNTLELYFTCIFWSVSNFCHYCFFFKYNIVNIYALEAIATCINHLSYAICVFMLVLLSLEFSCALIFCYYSWSSSYLVPPLCSIFLQMFEVPMSIASLSILFHQNHTNTMMLTLVLLFATDNIPKKNLMEIYSPRFSNYGHVSWKYQQKRTIKVWAIF